MAASRKPPKPPALMTDRAIVRWLLQHAQARVRDGWCQGAPARDVHGSPLIVAYTFEAKRWSATGALMAAHAELVHRGGSDVGGWTDVRVVAAVTALAKAISPNAEKAMAFHTVANWNDREDTKQEMVIDAFARAIGGK